MAFQLLEMLVKKEKVIIASAQTNSHEGQFICSPPIARYVFQQLLCKQKLIIVDLGTQRVSLRGNLLRLTRQSQRYTSISPEIILGHTSVQSGLIELSCPEIALRKK